MIRAQQTRLENLLKDNIFPWTKIKINTKLKTLEKVFSNVDSLAYRLLCNRTNGLRYDRNSIRKTHNKARSKFQSIIMNHANEN